MNQNTNFNYAENLCQACLAKGHNIVTVLRALGLSPSVLDGWQAEAPLSEITAALAREIGCAERDLAQPLYLNSRRFRSMQAREANQELHDEGCDRKSLREAAMAMLEKRVDDAVDACISRDSLDARIDNMVSRKLEKALVSVIRDKLSMMDLTITVNTKDARTEDE